MNSYLIPFEQISNHFNLQIKAFEFRDSNKFPSHNFRLFLDLIDVHNGLGKIEKM